MATRRPSSPPPRPPRLLLLLSLALLAAATTVKAFQLPLLPSTSTRSRSSSSSITSSSIRIPLHALRPSSSPLFASAAAAAPGQQDTSSPRRRRALPAFLSSLLRSRRSSSSPIPSSSNKTSKGLRIMMGALAVICLTGTVAHALPSHLLHPSSAGRTLLSATTAAAAPLSTLQDKLSQTLGQGPLAPIATLLSWVLDVVEVTLDGSSWLLRLLLWPILTPLHFLLHHLLLPALPLLSSLITSPRTAIPSLFHSLHSSLHLLLLQLTMGLSAYAQGLLALLFSTLGVVYQSFANFLSLFFNLPGLQYLDAMDPRRHIPSTPTRFVLPSTPLSLPSSSSFSLQQMYGRRWRVHAGKWSWTVPYWERVVMEAQLARYQNTFQKSVVKARFGFPEIIRGPSPLLGGTFLVLTGIYLIYRGHVTSAVWIRQLQKETYGDRAWNPQTRLEEEEGEEGGEEGGEDEGKKE